MKVLILIILFTSFLFAQSNNLLLFDDNKPKLPITNNLIAYYTPDGLSASVWVDESGNNRNLTLINSPTINNAALNGYKSVTFNGSNQYAKTSDFSIGEPLTFYIVMKDVTLVSDGVILGDKNLGTHALKIASSNRNTMYSPNNLIILNSPLSVYKIITGIFNGANSIGQKNQETIYTANTGTNTTSTGISLGCSRYSSPVFYANVEVVEIIYYSASHDLYTRTSIQNYLNKKYKIF